MDFAPSARVEELRGRIDAFVEEHVYPVELELLHELDEKVTVESGLAYPPGLAELRERAKAEGLWNLFMPDEEIGAGLTNWEYGMLCEAMGRSLVTPLVFNCSAPDTGNMEILHDHGTPEQKERWLEPLLEGEIRSCFSMTEPETAGSDPTGLRGAAELDGDEWVINAHKWFTSGAVGASVAIVMVVTDPDAAPHKRASMILVPTDNPGFNLVRPVSVMGHSGGPGHCEIKYENCRVPKDSLLGERGAGFKIAQDRLGPGRIHHCMRAIGAAERALEMMCRRAIGREAFGGKLAEKQFVQDFIAKSRIEIDGARLMVLNAAWRMDEYGKREARQEISMTKVVAANVVMDVLDRAMQVHGALGVSDDTPLAMMWRGLRMLRLADGPDEVHKMVIALRELKRVASMDSAAAPQPAGVGS
jgi:acyl-CoA dehydrogenase